MEFNTTEIQEELEEIKKEYEEVMAEANAEIAATETAVGATEMHIFNIVLATVMIVIGAILAYQSRNVTQKQKSGKKIAGWILLIIGALALITHVIQLIF